LLDVVDAFLVDQHIAGRRPLTIKRHRQELHRFGRHLELDQLDWCTITTVQLRAYLRTKAHLSASSRANLASTLRVFYRWAVEQELLESSPAASLPSPKRDKPVPRALSREQVRRLVAWLSRQQRPASRRDEALILTALYAGLRRVELARLRWSDVDLESGTIVVRLSKGGRGRVVVVHCALKGALAAWRSVQGPVGDGPVFDWKGMSISPDRVGKIVRRTSARCGIAFSAHCLRHTFATYGYRQSRDINSVSKALGHMELKQTLIYVQADPEDSRVAIESLPGLHDW